MKQKDDKTQLFTSFFLQSQITHLVVFWCWYNYFYVFVHDKLGVQTKAVQNFLYKKNLKSTGSQVSDAYQERLVQLKVPRVHTTLIFPHCNHSATRNKCRISFCDRGYVSQYVAVGYARYIEDGKKRSPFVSRTDDWHHCNPALNIELSSLQVLSSASRHEPAKWRRSWYIFPWRAASLTEFQDVRRILIQIFHEADECGKKLRMRLGARDSEVVRFQTERPLETQLTFAVLKKCCDQNARLETVAEREYCTQRQR